MHGGRGAWELPSVLQRTAPPCPPQWPHSLLGPAGLRQSDRQPADNPPVFEVKWYLEICDMLIPATVALPTQH